jgi:hypothetical protein
MKFTLIFLSLTGARVQRQSEQIWFYNRYVILIEYTKRPRLPPPIIIISYISNNSSFTIFILTLCLLVGLIHTAFCQCILTMKKYSDDKNTRELNRSSSTDNDDRSVIGRILKCRPCQKVIEDESNTNVRHLID